MSVIEIQDKAQFDALVKDNTYVALQAHASWCGPCKAISPFFVKHAAAHTQDGSYAFAKFDTDDVPDLAFELGIRTIPAFFFFANGTRDNDLAGANPAVLKKLVEDYSAKAKSGGAEEPAAAATDAAPAADAPAAEADKKEDKKEDEKEDKEEDKKEDKEDKEDKKEEAFTTTEDF